jgi:hypothetical protein
MISEEEAKERNLLLSHMTMGMLFNWVDEVIMFPNLIFRL